MKKILSLLIILSLLLAFTNLNAQINRGCSDFKNYNQMKDETTNLTPKEFFEPVVGYGASKAEAKYNCKIAILKELTENQMYLNNARVDSVLAEFAGEVVFLPKKKFDVFKTRKNDIHLGMYTCMAYETQYNKELIEFLKYYLNNFIKSSVVFIINPYIEKNGDQPTKDLYNQALNNLHTQCLQPKYKFDNVINLDIIERAKLPEKPANYNPAEGYRTYITGNKYLDFVNSIKYNENNSRQVDIVLSIDTITITKVPNSSQRIVNFHIIGYNVNTATEILVFDSKIEIEASNDFDAVDMAIKTVFERDIDKYMYDMVKRYSSYTRDGMLFTIKIAGTLLNQTKTSSLEQSMMDCKLFAESSINPSSWMNNGQKIGSIYEGRTYLLDRLRLKNNIILLLSGAGITHFLVNIEGTSYIVTPE